MNGARKRNRDGQSGASLLVVILILMALSTLGAVAIMTASTDLDVAANDKYHKMTFFAADGADEMTTELIEQNIEERGFSTATWGNVNILTGSFYANSEDPTPALNVPSDTNRDVEVANLGSSKVYLRVYGNSALSTGSALQITAGYEGLGKSVSGGGAQIVYDIRSLANGPAQSEARIKLRWRHLI
jgi:Tfp pilus assembly protein PilX